MENKRYKEAPPLLEGERIVAYRQGGYLSRRSWKLGHFYLTNMRLLFRQVKRLILDIPLENITALSFYKTPFILATKTGMCLSYRDVASGRLREAIIITPRLASFCERISEFAAKEGVYLKVGGVMETSDVLQARRDRVQEILAGIRAEEEAVAAGIKTKEEMTQARIDRILGKADGGVGTRRSDLARARRERVKEIVAEAHAQEEAEKERRREPGLEED